MFQFVGSGWAIIRILTDQENNFERTSAEEQSSQQSKADLLLSRNEIVIKTNAQISGMEHFKWDTSN